MFKRQRIVCITMAASLGVACRATELPVAPQEPITLAQRSAQIHFRNLEAPGPETISLSDYNGTTYTLDRVNRTLTLSSGHWVTLDQGMTDAVLAEFQGIIETDAVLDPLNASVIAWDPYGQCGQGGECETLRAWNDIREGKDTTPKPGIRLLMRKSQHSSPRGSKPRLRPAIDRSNFDPPPVDQSLSDGGPGLRQPSSLGSHRAKTVVSIALGNPIGPSLEGGPCSNIAQAVLNGLPAYGYQRQSSLGQLRSAVIGEVVNYGMGKLIPVGGWVAVQMGSIFVQAEINRTAVAVLGWMWNSAGCGSQHVTIGPVIKSGGTSNSSGQFHWECEWEAWEISFNGGETWYPIEVWVCRQAPGAQ